MLHGLCRSAASMVKMERYLEEAGYVVVNQTYPSRKLKIAELSERVVGTALRDQRLEKCKKIHFVTHSLGGILVRAYYEKNPPGRLSRVVMLGPPNKGSEVVDCLGTWQLFKWINGPAGAELGTREESLPRQLGRVEFEAGIVAGDRSINWINSMMIDGKDDGKVSVERTKVEGMNDHVVVHTRHPFMMKNQEVLELTLTFLERGSFERVRSTRQGDH